MGLWIGKPIPEITGECFLDLFRKKVTMEKQVFKAQGLRLFLSFYWILLLIIIIVCFESLGDDLFSWISIPLTIGLLSSYTAYRITDGVSLELDAEGIFFNRNNPAQYFHEGLIVNQHTAEKWNLKWSRVTSVKGFRLAEVPFLLPFSYVVLKEGEITHRIYIGMFPQVGFEALSDFLNVYAPQINIK
jgi:hypothetical protein